MSTSTPKITTLNVWNTRWDLDEASCPCDIHFNEWLAAESITGKVIFHFGTGTHHVVGERQAENGSGNVILGVTASAEEYDTYIKLALAKPHVAKRYVVYFGDIYLTDPRLLPALDVVTLFHLCEFFSESTATPDYGGMTDLQIAELFARKLRPGGCMLLYTGSFAFDKAQAVLEICARTEGLTRLGAFKSLLVFGK
ncbi:MAG: hypothetical protein QOD74_246 [Variibacter sp.]|nr:hypothetical protein [Variibacter sp.]